jgi:hypothetical protein
MDFGFRAEKDAGERFKWDPKTNRYGVDHISMFLSLENKGPFKKITVGDFTVQWDQGLILGGGLSFRKQAVIGPRKVHSGIVPHTGSGEYGYHQGVGAELEFRGTAVSAFYSRRLLDTQIQTQDTVNHLPSIITSIIQTGLHRTPAELKNRKKVSQQVIGVHIKKTWSPNLAISVSGLYRILGKPMIPDSKRYNQHTFSGNRNLNLSTGFEYLWNNLNLYGQFAVSSSGGQGTLVGLTASLYHNLSMTLHFRNYSKDFHGISGRAFGINSQNTNEQGIYWAFQYSPHPKWTAGFYTDIYKTLSPTFISDAGYSGIDKLFRLQFFPHKRGLIDIYYRGTNRAVNSKPLSGKSTHDQIDATKHMAGLRAKWQGEKNISLQCRLQYSRYHVSESITHGGIVSNQVSYTLDFLKITANMTLFDTDNFENRQYIYEKDLPNSLSVPFFHGVGTRGFFMLQLKVVENLGFWLKFGESNYFDRNQLGAGPDRIENSKRSDLSLQIRYKL